MILYSNYQAKPFRDGIALAPIWLDSFRPPFLKPLDKRKSSDISRKWDKRKEDSVRFAYCNLDFFTDLLESLGISFQYKHEKLDPYSDMLFYNAVIFHTGIKIHNIELFLGSFINIHSTLIQNFIKGFYEVVKHKYPKHNFGNFNFPMY